MIQIDAATRNLLLNNSIRREIILRFPDDDFEITGNNIVAESFELTQSVCDGKELKLGGGVVGKMRIKVFDTAHTFTGKRVNVILSVVYSSGRLVPSLSLTPSQTRVIGERQQTIQYRLFSGIVRSAVRQKNRSVRELTAYDAMYELSKSTFTADAITAMIDYRFQSETVLLYDFVLAVLQTQFNDEVITHDDTAHFSYDRYLRFDRTSINTVAKKGVNALKFLQAYAEAEAGFIVCRGDGSLHVKSFSKYVPGDSLGVTAKKDVDEVIPAYRKLSFEEYTTKPITYTQFQYLNDHVYRYYADKQNSRYISDNVLFRMCSDISHFVRGYWNTNGRNYLFYNLLTYRPFKAEVFDRWWLEPGDRVQIQTGCTDIPVVDSFVLCRKIKGINGMNVTVEAKGNEYLGNKEVEISNE